MARIFRIVGDIKDRVNAKDIGHGEEVKVEGMVADHESVVGEAAEDFCLFGELNALGFFDGFEGSKEVGDGASTADAGEERGYADRRFTGDGSGVEAAVVLDFKFQVGDLTIIDNDFQASRAFDFSDSVDGDFAAVHRI